MIAKLFFLLAITSQAIGGGWKHKPAISPVDRYTTSFIQLEGTLNDLQEPINLLKDSIYKSLANYDFQIDEVAFGINNMISQLDGQIQLALNYIHGAKLILADFQTAAPNIPDEWFEPIKHLQRLAWISITEVKEGIPIISSVSKQLATIQETYLKAKEAQAIKTSQQIEENQQALEQFVKSVAAEGLALFRKNFDEWSTFLRNKLGSEADAAIEKMTEMAASAISDLEKMRPEDTDRTVEDIHRAIDDMKIIFDNYDFEADVVHELFDNFQTNFLKIIYKIRNYTSTVKYVGYDSVETSNSI